MSVAEGARRMARAAFELRPFWLDPPYELARAYAVPLLRWRHPLRRLVGRARDGQPAAVLMAGQGSSFDVEALARSFFLAPPEEEMLASVPGPVLAHRLAELLDSHDLVLARTWNLFARNAAAAGLLTLPHMPDLMLPGGSAEAMLARANKSIRRTVRRCDDEGYCQEISAGSSRFDEFYLDYHLPFVRMRHGADVVEHSPEVLRRRLRRGGISWTQLDGEPLFAVAFDIVEDSFRELVAGTPSGRVDAVIQRARCASRAGHVRLIGERGLRSLYMGSCRPWLSDGMLLNKRAWGGNLVPRRDDVCSVLVGWRQWRPAIARFLADHPLVVRALGGFAAITASLDSQTPPTYWRERLPGGLRELHVVTRAGVRSTALTKAGPERTTVLPGEPSSAALGKLIRAENPLSAGHE
jgi:hypothetical protein